MKYKPFYLVGVIAILTITSMSYSPPSYTEDSNRIFIESKSGIIAAITLALVVAIIILTFVTIPKKTNTNKP